MVSSRVEVFRSAVDALVESLEAVIRISRWSGAESTPEPLVSSAGKLVDRLGVANRLSRSRFQGSPTEARKVEAICAVLKRLDAAYLTYRQSAEGAHARSVGDDAAAALETEIANTRAASSAWS